MNLEPYLQAALDLIRCLRSPDDSGQHRPPEADFTRILPWLVIHFDVELSDLPEEIQDQVNEFVVSLGLDEPATVGEVEDAVEAYFEHDHCTAALRRDIEEAVRRGILTVALAACDHDEPGQRNVQATRNVFRTVLAAETSTFF